MGVSKQEGARSHHLIPCAYIQLDSKPAEAQNLYSPRTINSEGKVCQKKVVTDKESLFLHLTSENKTMRSVCQPLPTTETNP